MLWKNISRKFWKKIAKEKELDFVKNLINDMHAIILRKRNDHKIWTTTWY